LLLDVRNRIKTTHHQKKYFNNATGWNRVLTEKKKTATRFSSKEKIVVGQLRKSLYAICPGRLAQGRSVFCLRQNLFVAVCRRVVSFCLWFFLIKLKKTNFNKRRKM